MSELTYEDFKQRINIQEVLQDAGYRLNRKDGIRYPSTCAWTAMAAAFVVTNSLSPETGFAVSNRRSNGTTTSYPLSKNIRIFLLNTHRGCRRTDW